MRNSTLATLKVVASPPWLNPSCPAIGPCEFCFTLHPVLLASAARARIFSMMSFVWLLRQIVPVFTPIGGSIIASTSFAASSHTAASRSRQIFSHSRSPLSQRSRAKASRARAIQPAQAPFMYIGNIGSTLAGICAHALSHNATAACLESMANSVRQSLVVPLPTVRPHPTVIDGADPFLRDVEIDRVLGEHMPTHRALSPLILHPFLLASAARARNWTRPQVHL